MGWSSIDTCLYKRTRKGQVIDRKATLDMSWNEDSSANYKVVKSAVVGTTYYAAIKKVNTGDIFGHVTLTSVKDGELWCKDMDETMGPCAYECPITILKLLTPTDNEYANGWRQKCVEYRNKQIQYESIPVGTKIKTKLGCDEEKVLELSIYRGRKTWVCWAEYTKYKAKDVFSYPFEIIETGE